MLFSSKGIAAIVLSLVHILISFLVRLPERYKNNFRVYAVAVNLLFIGFLLSFPFLFDLNHHFGTYYNGLATLYFLLIVPLGAALLWSIRNTIMKADIEPFFLKLILIFGALIVAVGLIVLGYALFILTFYGFAP